MGDARSRSARGTRAQPKNRFANTSREPDPDAGEVEEPLPRTQFIPDLSQTILARNDSPDIGYEVSLNPYRGCEHGCIYCYARPTHEYLGFSAGLDFESRILVKERAPELLRCELSSPAYQPKAIAMSGVTDPYQPVERRLQLTRRCLEVLAECRHPVSIVTKNRLVTRDLDLLRELARHQAVAVCLSLPTLDTELRRVMEPRTSPPSARLEVIATLAEAKVPVGVLLAPVIPAMTDHELPALISAAARAGARFAGYTVLRLPLGVASLFEEWLARHYPERREKVLRRIRSLRGGRLNDPRFGKRLRGEGVFADQIARLFEVACRQARIDCAWPALSSAAFRPPATGQLFLFP